VILAPVIEIVNNIEYAGQQSLKDIIWILENLLYVCTIHIVQ